MVAAVVAAGVLLAPAPASAKLTFGRAADVAEQQVIKLMGVSRMYA